MSLPKAIAAVLFMAITLALGVMFSVFTFDRFYRDALVTESFLPLRHLQVNLQRAVGQGLRLEGAIGAKREIEHAQAFLADLVAGSTQAGAGPATPPTVLLISPTGDVHHVAGEGGGSYRLWKAIDRALNTPNGPGEVADGRRYVKDDDSYVIPLKLFDRDAEWAYSLVAVLPADAVDGRSDALFEGGLRRAGLLGAVALLAYVLAVAPWRRRREPVTESTNRRLLWVSVAFGTCAQLACAGVGGMRYIEPYHQATDAGARVLVRLAQTDTESALRRGTLLENLDFRQYPWQPLLREINEFGALDVMSADGHVIARVDSRGVRRFDAHAGRQATVAPEHDFGQELFRYAHLDQRDRIAGHLVVRVSRDALRERAFDLAADGLASTMISILVLIEILLLISLRHDTREPTSAKPKTPVTDAAGLAMIRPAAFLLLFGIDLSMSFVPLYMEQLYEPILGLSKDFVIGLPISVEFLFVGLAILSAGSWIDRRGWREPFLWGVALAGLGTLLSWLAPDALTFVASRAILGIGYGFALMAGQGFVIANTDSSSKASGLARLFAGVYGGSICGGVAGAILAERLGYGPVFLTGAVVIFLVLVYATHFLPATRIVREAPATAVAARAGAPGPLSRRLARFVTNRTMLGLILFSSLPASVAAVGFLNYFSPIYLNRIGTSQSTIGQVLMLYGVCLVFLGPWVSRGIDTPERKRLAVVAGCVVGAAAFLSFNVLSGLAAATVAVLALGLSHSLVLSAQSAYALALKVSRDLGEGKAISVFRSTSRIGQMLGPIAFGSVVVATDIERGVAILGYVYLVLAVLFWLMTRNDRGLLVEGEA